MSKAPTSVPAAVASSSRAGPSSEGLPDAGRLATALVKRSSAQPPPITHLEAATRCVALGHSIKGIQELEDEARLSRLSDSIAELDSLIRGQHVLPYNDHRLSNVILDLADAVKYVGPDDRHAADARIKALRDRLKPLTGEARDTFEDEYRRVATAAMTMASAPAFNTPRLFDITSELRPSLISHKADAVVQELSRRGADLTRMHADLSNFLASTPNAMTAKQIESAFGNVLSLSRADRKTSFDVSDLSSTRGVQGAPTVGRILAGLRTALARALDTESTASAKPADTGD